MPLIHRPKLLIFSLVFLNVCASLSRGQSEIDAKPLTEGYKKYRATRRSLYIQNFDNRTFSPQLTGRLKEKLQYTFARRASLSVTTEKKTADLVLYGKILMYSEEPGVYDRNSMPITYNLSLVVSAKMRMNRKNEPDEPSEAETENISEDLVVRYMDIYNKGEPIFETRYMAEDRMLDGLAERIVNSIYEPPPVEENKKQPKHTQHMCGSAARR